MKKLLGLIPTLKDCELLEDLLKKEIWGLKSNSLNYNIKMIQKCQQLYDCILDVKHNLENKSGKVRIFIEDGTIKEK